MQKQDRFYPLFLLIHKLLSYISHERTRNTIKHLLPLSKPRKKYPYKYHIQESFDISTDLSILSHDTLKNAFIAGNFQKLSYFKHIDSIIRTNFTLRTPLSPNNKSVKRHILSTPNSVFIHIRRGDYLDIWDFIELGKVYYESAIKTLLSHIKNPHFFIFSNDIEWCKNEFISHIDSGIFAGNPWEFVEQNGEESAVEELELMRSCKHGIIANSTFSWWAAYLIENPQKVIVTPNRFFWTPPPQRPNHIDDILPDGWIRIDPTWGSIKE